MLGTLSQLKLTKTAPCPIIMDIRYARVRRVPTEQKEERK